MSEPWRYQLRVYLPDDRAAEARRGLGDAALQPLAAVLAKHDATLLSQLDAFEAYVAEAEAGDTASYPLYKWTKATLADPDKRAKHARSFAIHVAGNEAYGQTVADALEADLQPLAGGDVVTQISRHDTNPANNLPVPPEYRS